MKIALPTTKNVIKTGRFEIPYRIYENNGPQLICLNGIQQSMAMWQSFVTRFAADYSITLFDFPGQGNGRTISGPIRAELDEEVDILYEVMNKTRIKRDVIFCTASWGGIIALAFAAKYPQTVKRLLLGSIGTKPNRQMAEMIQKGCTIDQNNRDQIADLIIEIFGQKLPDAIKKKIGVQFRSISSENLQAFHEHGVKVLSVQKLSDHIDLKKIEAESVIILGKEDTIVDLDDVVYLSSQIPNCQLKVIENVGHFLHLESEEVLDVYHDLLSNNSEYTVDTLLAEC